MREGGREGEKEKVSEAGRKSDSRMAVGFLTRATFKNVRHKSYTSGHCLLSGLPGPGPGEGASLLDEASRAGRVGPAAGPAACLVG